MLYSYSLHREVQLLKSDFGIDTRDFFYPMHKQPVMIRKGYIKKYTKMPVSERLWEDGLYLPSSTDLKEEQIVYIADALRKLRREGGTND